jgi:outer membrane immunogenic protein
MKKMMLLGVLLVFAAAVGNAQESRQDFSVSADGVFGPDVHGLGAQEQAKGALGFLASYRYSVTPRSQLEVNYGFLQGATKYVSDDFTGPLYEHDRQEEITGAYVYTRNYRNWNPFVEIGVGGMIFTEIRDYKTDELSTKQNTNIGGLAGGGVAYEISPSFDIRAEYRGFLVKAPDYGYSPYKTNRYEWLSLPSIGIAYHF